MRTQLLLFAVSVLLCISCSERKAEEEKQLFQRLHTTQLVETIAGEEGHYTKRADTLFHRLIQTALLTHPAIQEIIANEGCEYDIEDSAFLCVESLRLLDSCTIAGYVKIPLLDPVGVGIHQEAFLLLHQENGAWSVADCYTEVKRQKAQEVEVTVQGKSTPLENVSPQFYRKLVKDEIVQIGTEKYWYLEHIGDAYWNPFSNGTINREYRLQNLRTHQRVSLIGTTLSKQYLKHNAYDLQEDIYDIQEDTTLRETILWNKAEVAREYPLEVQVLLEISALPESIERYQHTNALNQQWLHLWHTQNSAEESKITAVPLQGYTWKMIKEDPSITYGASLKDYETAYILLGSLLLYDKSSEQVFVLLGAERLDGIFGISAIGENKIKIHNGYLDWQVSEIDLNTHTTNKLGYPTYTVKRKE